MKHRIDFAAAEASDAEMPKDAPWKNLDFQYNGVYSSLVDFQGSLKHVGRWPCLTSFEP